MKSTDTGRSNKVQFYAALALLLSALPAAAAELSIPMDEVERELSQKTEEVFSRKLNECQQEQGSKEVGKPAYPVRIADRPPVKGGALGYQVGLPLTAL
ncbi:hypothetical protein AUP74_02793 [Microbulbifer aggregans]|uniref:Uncharacterized protein n=1 Tax=Microbulbifer aggregans TaxID=1769779 RepID=A0A1C9WAL0_9GAMM|nr:hypothetical protein [Microbulbifer aggregans]AOS98188.1 hypothetical protein AUP74_02793 [Microbulbifer aggregans]